MKVVIQIVKEAKLTVNDKLVSSINEGYVIFVGFESTDTEQIITKMVDKIVHLRINKDINDKTNLSILDCNKEILSVSQFTLCANCESRRPSFSNAMEANKAKNYYEIFNNKLKEYQINVKTGVFKEHMLVNLTNDGPFTIYLDSNQI